MKAPRSKPPALARRLLGAVLERGEHDTLVGDFDELYATEQESRGPAAARRWYWGQIVRLFPSYAFHSLRWSAEMFGTDLTTGLRNIKKHRGYALINILGLAIGLAACLLVVLYAKDELSFDRFNTKADRISRVMTKLVRQGKEMNLSGVGAPMAAALRDGFPEVEDAVRFRGAESLRVRYGDRRFRENRAIHADPSFFNIFTVPLARGDARTALVEPHTLVLSRTTAAKYFGTEDPVGKTLQVTAGDTEDYTVTGVFEDIPRASHFHFDIIISLSTLEESRVPVWNTFNFPTYLLLREGTSAAAVEAKLPSLINPHLDAEFRQSVGASLDQWLSKSGMSLDYHLQPLTRIHLYTQAGVNEFEPPSDIRYIYLFAAVALFILVLAAANFINLSTARSSGRAKEVGLRKVMGSPRGALVKQFLTESVLLSVIALALAVLLVRVALPLFNRLTAKEMSPALLREPATVAAAFGLALLIGLLAGAYPAFVLSSFRPSPMLRDSSGGRVKGGRLRRALVVFQFAVSALMIIGTVVVSLQLRYIQTKKLGFNKNQVIVLRKTYLLQDRADALKEEMLQYPGVLKTSLSSFLPVPSSRARMPVAREGEADPTQALPIAVWTVDYDYIDTLEMSVVAGRNFSREHPTDKNAVLLNRTAARHFGFADGSTVEGRLLIVDVDTKNGQPVYQPAPMTVIGVLEDFHFESLRSKIEPLVLRLGESRGNLILRVRPGEVFGTIETLRQKWTGLLPGEPFDYALLDDSFDAMYRSELRIGQTFRLFAALAVFIGCLGLFGLAAFSAAKRTKEIGIRKVLGATSANIVRLFVKEYLALVVLANIISWPIAYWAMSRWLDGFAYRTEISWVVFAATAALTLGIAMLAVASQSVKAAATDPAVVLKYE
jgi:putative ABC transport system permease protein